MCGKIIMLHEEGRGEPYICLRLKLSRSAVRYTIEKNKQRPDGKTLPRAGARKCFIQAEERKLLRHVRLNPKQTYKQVKEALYVV
jgi:hypothetical protein